MTRKAPGLLHFPVKVEQRLGKLLLERLEIMYAMVLDEIDEGAPPSRAVQTIEQLFADVPFETDRVIDLIEHADRQATRVIAKEVHQQLGGKKPTSRAPARPPADQVEKKADAADEEKPPPQSELRAVADQVGVDGPAFARQIKRRASSIEQRMFVDIEEAIKQAVREGASNRELERVLEKQFNVAANQVRFVARDGMGSLNSQISRVKNQALGFTHYRWVSSEDRRVRPEHAVLNDTIRAWDSPHPTEGHPGDAPNCRCVAVPVVPDAQEEQRGNRAAVGAAAVGVGVGIAVGAAVATKRMPELMVRVRNMRGRKPGPPSFAKAARRRSEQARKGLRVARPGESAPRVQPGTPLPAAEPAAASSGGRVLPFTVSETVMRRARGRELFKLAHDVVRGVLAAEIRQGVPLAQRSNYAATLQLTLREIRKAQRDGGLRERLIALANRGRVEPYRGRRLLRKGAGKRAKPRRGKVGRG